MAVVKKAARRENLIRVLSESAKKSAKKFSRKEKKTILKIQRS